MPSFSLQRRTFPGRGGERAMSRLLDHSHVRSARLLSSYNNVMRLDSTRFHRAVIRRAVIQNVLKMEHVYKFNCPSVPRASGW